MRGWGAEMVSDFPSLKQQVSYRSGTQIWFYMLSKPTGCFSSLWSAHLGGRKLMFIECFLGYSTDSMSPDSFSYQLPKRGISNSTVFMLQIQKFSQFTQSLAGKGRSGHSGLLLVSSELAAGSPQLWLPGSMKEFTTHHCELLTSIYRQSSTYNSLTYIFLTLQSCEKACIQ